MLKLKSDYDFFMDNHDEFVKKHLGKVLVIKENKVIGVYDTDQDAYFKTQEDGHELGTFLIQQVLANKDAYKQTFHSRVVI